MQAKEQNDNYICKKHNQVISLIVMDKGLKPADQLFCLQCMSLNRQPLNKVVGIELAKEMIKEQLTQKFAEQEGTLKQNLGKLQAIHKKLIELRQNILLSLETTILALEKWMSDLNNLIQYNNPIDLIKGLEKLQEEQQEFNNLIEQHNKTYQTKIDQAFQKLLNNEGIQQCYKEILQFQQNCQSKLEVVQINNIPPNAYSMTPQSNFKPLKFPQPQQSFTKIQQFKPINTAAFQNQQLKSPIPPFTINKINQPLSFNTPFYKPVQQNQLPETNIQPHSLFKFRQLQHYSKQNKQNAQQIVPIDFKIIKRIERISKRIDSFSNNRILRFNNTGEIMLEVEGNGIEVYLFDQGQQLDFLTKLDCQASISCLIFSKKNQFFISGDVSGQITSWKQGLTQKQWIYKNAEKKNIKNIKSVLLNQEENELLSCSEQFIFFWSVNYETHQIEYLYTLENPYEVNQISLNESGTAFVATDGFSVFLWIKCQDDKWRLLSMIDQCVKTLFFINESEILIDNRFLYEIRDSEIIKQKQLDLKLNDNTLLECFKSIYYKHTEIILQVPSQQNYAYLISKPNNEQVQVDAFPIKFDPLFQLIDVVGTMTEDGDHLVISCVEVDVFNMNYEDSRYQIIFKIQYQR